MVEGCIGGVFLKKIISLSIITIMFLNQLSVFGLESCNTLKFDDFISIYKDKNYKKEQTDAILNIPIVNNNINVQSNYTYKTHPKLKELVILTQWDLEQNKSFEKIKNAFFSPEKLIETSLNDYNSNSFFLSSSSNKENSIDKFETIKEKITKQSNILNNADILVFNNITIGMPENDYKNTPLEIAQMLKYNYAFIPEFIEVDPVYIGLEPTTEYNIDQEKYKGLSGTAIISRFPLENVRIKHLTDVYDWYDIEKNNNYALENASRYAMKSVFKEENTRNVRVGGRKALLADIKLPNQEKFTIVATQIEKRTRPNDRAKQVKNLLEQIKDIKNPVILAGNLNTTTYNHQPKGVKNVVKNKFTDPDALAETVFFFIVPVGVVVSWLVRPVFDIFRKVNDPTVISIPIFSPNREKKMFNAIKKFEFDDGYKFDFRGNPNTSIGSSKKMFSSSNERGKKGYISTYKTQRNLGISNYKISWIIAKSYNTKTNPNPKKDDISERMAPHFGMTLYELNFSYAEPIAIQAPISAVFPICDYNK